MEWTSWFVGLFAVTLVLTALEYVAVYQLRSYRIDIGPGASPFSGGSVFVQINAFHPKNYSEEGKQRLRWLYAITAGRWLVTLATFWTGYEAFFS